jgi:copper chaperone CopZ
MTELILPVTGMTCGGCENAVQRALGQLPGVTHVAASHRDSTVRVAFNPAQVTRADLERKIGQLGYAVGTT